MPQLRIDRLFGSSSSKTPDEALEVATAVRSTPAAHIEEEIQREDMATEMGLEFVKNGSRDRWGFPRRNVGGRPRKRPAPEDQPAEKTNRKRAGCRDRKEFSARERVLMCAQIRTIQEECRRAHVGKKEKVLKTLENRAIRKFYPHLQRVRDVNELLRTEGRSKEILVKNRLGADISNPGRRARGANLAFAERTRGVIKSAGFRKPGGGRKNKFQKIWNRVKIWHTVERLKGLQVDEQDIWINLQDQMTMEIEVLRYLQKRGKLHAPQLVWLGELEDRLMKLRSSRGYREVYLARLQSWAGMSAGRPQRRSSMSLAQEKLGWQVSMNSWDRAIWLAAFGSEEDLRGQVAIPQDFMKQRKNIAIVTSDQVPIWVARQGHRTVFAAHEKVRDSKSSKRTAGERREIRDIRDIQWSQKLPEKVKELAKEAAAESMTQRRSGAGGEGEDEKFRLTLELRHAVLRFFEGPHIPPEYHELPPILVVWGVHARISNISKDRRWLEDEEFWIGDQHIVRRKGQKVGGILENWCKLRDEDPEVFEKVIVMQQPSATFDEVLVSWDLEDLAKRFPATVLQRDLLSGALTSRTKMAAQLLHIITCWVGPGMTPVVQLTDTDFSFILKRALEFYKQEIARLRKEVAVRDGTKFSMKFDAREIMYIVSRAAEEVKKNAEAKKLGIQGLRRNGQLMTGPHDGKIVELAKETFPWLGDKEFEEVLQVGGHRYPTSWLADRYSHIKEGIPQKVEWPQVLEESEKQLDQDAEVKKLVGDERQEEIMERLGKIRFDCTGEDFAMEHEVRICGNNVKIPVMCMEIDWSEDLMSSEHLKELSKTPLQRRAEKEQFPSRHNDRGLQGEARKIGRGVRLRCALGKFSEEVQKQIDTQLMKHTRYEVFKKLQFMAGKKKKFAKLAKEVAKVKALAPKSAKEIKAKVASMKLKTLKDKVFLGKDDLKVSPKVGAKGAKVPADPAKEKKVD